MLTASNSSLKHTCSAFTSVTSTLEVNFNVMLSINSHFTYLLIDVLLTSHVMRHQSEESFASPVHKDEVLKAQTLFCMSPPKPFIAASLARRSLTLHTVSLRVHWTGRGHLQTCNVMIIFGYL